MLGISKRTLPAAAILAYGVAVMASAAAPMVPAIGAIRAVACAVLVGILFSARRTGPRFTFRVLGWCLLSLVAGWAMAVSGAFGNPAIVLALFFGFFLRRTLVPWTEKLSSRRLAGVALAGILPLAMGFAFGWGNPAKDTVLTRVDRSLATLAEAWLLVAGIRSSSELLRRWIRRASVRMKLIVSFAIFAITPALLAFFYASLAGWMHAGELRASAVTQYLELTSRGRDFIERETKAVPPRDAADLAQRIEANREALTSRGIAAAALTRGTGGWSVAGVPLDPDSLFRPVSAPVADTTGAVHGLALRGGRLWWAETAVWPRSGDSLALSTFEPVDSNRVDDYARLFRCNLLLATSQTMSAGDSAVTVGGKRPGSVRHFRTAGGAVEISTDTPLPPAMSDSAALDSVQRYASLTMVGGGDFRHVTSLHQIHGVFNSGASPPCYLWTGSGWRKGSMLLLLRSSYRDGIALTTPSTGPFSTAMKVVLIVFITLFVIVEIVSVLVGSRVASFITRGASNLRAAAGAIGRGDFSTRVQVPSEDELGSLAASFNRMAEGLEEGQRAMLEREQLRHELELARRIQSRLLPSGPPQVPPLDIAAANFMSQQVGGDYYDFLAFPGGRLGICIADVAGKGVAAALLMSNVKAALVSSAAVESSTDRLTTRVNRILEQSIEPGRFVTFFLASLDPTTLHLEYVNAGHPPPILLRADGSAERLSEGGTILGILPDAAYARGTVTLGPGDVLALFTDGVTEAQGRDEELFGEERIESLLREGPRGTASETLERLLGAVRSYEGERGPSDDLTAIVIRVSHGPSQATG
jgi:serine phosphatase RsbU (regulator of sigma subunit)